MHNLDDPTPEDLEVVRAILRDTHPVDTMTDDELVAAMSESLAERIPAPAPKEGSAPTNGRVWLHEALTAGGFKQPEDRHQRANLGDGGDTIDLGVLGILVIRHMANAFPPAPWTDERLARETGMPVDDLRRGQRLLDEVAADVGREPKLGHRWWE
ncbi:hypothetical protein DSM104299_04252 [Baekduia alba]|uniref:hypothetical protein n=1 Tax=Baekduia alba TaxID=2997333 RepID=UPI0023400DE4|nr:hypothetical protein [Baekduia alba]WCB95504.1 hypothetical protein DSM104299_04252 [Baekduia alba]